MSASDPIERHCCAHKLTLNKEIGASSRRRAFAHTVFSSESEKSQKQALRENPNGRRYGVSCDVESTERMQMIENVAPLLVIRKGCRVAS